MARFLIITATSGANRELADVFATTATAKGHDGDVIDLAEMDFPMFTIARSKNPEEAPDISEMVSDMTQSDAWVVIAPEYNGSMPPTLNNALAWMSTSMDWKSFRTLCTGKPVGLATPQWWWWGQCHNGNAPAIFLYRCGCHWSYLHVWP